jgi:hypothetical protein
VDDFNGDGTPDVIVAKNWYNATTGRTATVVAKGGKNGTHLWSETWNKAYMDFYLFTLLGGDFSCDDNPDVLVYTLNSINGYGMVLLEGKSGRHIFNISPIYRLSIASLYMHANIHYQTSFPLFDFRYDLNCDGISDLLVYNDTHMYVITKVTPAGDSAESSRGIKNMFLLEENVYAIGRGFVSNSIIDLYVVADRDWTNQDIIPRDISDGVETARADAQGDVFALVWQSPLLRTGEYDIVFDANQNGIYDAGIDAVDGVSPGFVVVKPSEVPLFSPLGLIVLACLLGLIAICLIEKRK